MTEAIWYFDFISPFAYLQFSRLSQLPADLRVTMKPILFAALLEHHGHKGPAEIPSKRQFVYRFFKWQAARRGVPFNMPPMHPFQPLPPLRLAIAAGGTSEVVGRIFDFIYGRGRNVEGAALLELGRELGLDNLETRITDPQVKERLRQNTKEAISAGVFGVPSFVARGELFWGDDATDMLLDFIKNPALFEDPEMVRLSNMPMGVRRARRNSH
jgi:2-hydroxychromene-2-carboxylate isomerase